MKNLIKDIRQNCEDLTLEGIVSFMNKRGDLSYTSDYHREIYFFYIEARKLPLKHREAKQTVMELFKIGSTTFKTIMRKYKGAIE